MNYTKKQVLKIVRDSLIDNPDYGERKTKYKVNGFTDHDARRKFLIILSKESGASIVNLSQAIYFWSQIPKENWENIDV